MPNVIVTCVFNPPVISIQGTSIRQDTIDALQRALPKQTTTSMASQNQGTSAKFFLTYTGGNEAPSAPAENATQDSVTATATATSANGNETSGYKSWCIDLGQHYCDQKGRSMILLTVMEALEEEGFALRGTNTVVTEQDKDVTRLIFARA